ncbi:MAG: oxidoreductase [Candidatus Hydrothermales bacterium]
MAEKSKVAFYWCASCGGCEEAMVDLAEDILQVVEKAEFVLWPVAMDFKREDVENLKDEEILVTFINGAVRTSEQEEMVRLLRKKSKILIAFGACAYTGGVPGLANCYSREEILNFYYKSGDTVFNPEDKKPTPHFIEGNFAFEIPEFYGRVYAVDQVVDVDYYIPGCAPTRKVVKNAIDALFSSQLPQKGSILGASSKSLCNECPLNETKPEKIYVKKFKRVDKTQPEPDKCLLIQGYPCLGPVTRGGCEALCVKANYPCTGCFGPLDDVKDYGAKAVSFLASIIDSNDEKEIEKIIDEGLSNPLAIVYRYSLPKSLIFDTKIKKNGG